MMKEKKVEKTKHGSWKIGKLSKGCSLCVLGRKLVLFVTGLCSRNCYYCSLSDVKKNKDDIWANERKIGNYKDIIEEARKNKAKGAGITGGNPFLRFERTVKLIKILKKEFGKRFHIHLYAPTELITKEKLKRIERAGLDEIRIHPDIDNAREWYKIDWLKNYKFDCGIEIPAIPGKEKENIELIKFVNGKIDFMNINELEISETNTNEFLKKGLRCKDRLSYAIKGSEKTALDLLRYSKNHKIEFNIHYCTAKLKDNVQLRNRIMIRAESTAKIFEKITPDGTIIMGAIYLDELRPGFGYRRNIERVNNDKKEKRNILLKLIKLKNKIIKNTNIKNTEIDEMKLRFITSVEEVKINKNKIKKIGLIPAVVEEYPTYDATEMDVEFL